MTDLTPTSTTPPAAAPAPAKKSPWLRVAYGFIAAAAIVVGAAKIYDFFVLPDCDASKVTEALTGIFTKTGATVKTITDIKPVTDASSPRACGAIVEATDERAAFEYEIAWDGWSPIVKVTRVSTETPSTTTPN